VQRRGRGRPPKEKATKRLIVFRPASLFTRLTVAARAAGTDVSALVSRIVDAYLKRERRAR
jgi:hypothetical protein